jgi:hypothetical protein
VGAVGIAGRLSEWLSGGNETWRNRRCIRLRVILDVMAGLVPAIHAAPLRSTLEVRDGLSAWMPGTRPGMTWSSWKRRSTATEFCSPDSPRFNGLARQSVQQR